MRTHAYSVDSSVRLVLVAVAVGLAACSGDSSPPESAGGGGLGGWLAGAGGSREGGAEVAASGGRTATEGGAVADGATADGAVADSSAPMGGNAAGGGGNAAGGSDASAAGGTASLGGAGARHDAGAGEDVQGDAPTKIDAANQDAGDASCGDVCSVDDANADHSNGADAQDSDANTCVIGTVTSQATASNLSLFGTPVYFNSGNPLPAGTYEVSYVDGCMKYSGGQGWTVNAYDGGCCSWRLIGESTSDEKLVLPGTIGWDPGAGAFASFDDCVTASLAAAPKQFVHGGGKLGIWLADSNYGDNLPGTSDRNPTFRLVKEGMCTDDAGDAASD